MSFSNTQINEVIFGTGNGNGQKGTGFRTPQPSIVGNTGEEAGKHKGFEMPRGGTRGGGTGRGGNRQNYTLKQRKLEDSLKLERDSSLKRKERSPEEVTDKHKKEKKVEEEDKSYKDIFARGGRVKRSPVGGENKTEEAQDTGEEEAGNMDQVLKKLEEMNKKMDAEREDRKKMMKDWEKRYDALEKKINKKVDEGLRMLEGKIKEEAEERKRVRREWMEAQKGRRQASRK